MIGIKSPIRDESLRDAAHPTDDLAAEIRRLYGSVRPEEVEEAMRLRQRWARRLRRREARRGTRGRRGARSDGGDAR